MPNNQIPSASIELPDGTQSISIGESVYFRGTAHDSDGDIVSHRWTFDNSGVADDMRMEPGRKTFNAQGVFKVTYMATDDDGATGSDTVTIEVGTPATTGLIHDWRFESDNITADNQNNGALTNNGQILTESSGAEPNPPGFGSHGAVFNGSDQWFSMAATDWHPFATWQSGQPNGTAAIMFLTPSTYPALKDGGDRRSIFLLS